MTIVKQTVFGAAKMALDPQVDPVALRTRVTSPNGTTAAALAVLMDPNHGLLPVMYSAVDAATQRLRKLGE